MVPSVEEMETVSEFFRKLFSRALWTSIFGWDAFFRWDVLGAMVPGVFLACGVGLMSIEWFPNNLLVSQVCFVICGVLCVIKTIGHAWKHPNSTLRHKVVFCLLICSPLVILDYWVISVIQSHKNKSGTVGRDSGRLILSPATSLISVNVTFPEKLEPEKPIPFNLNFTNSANYSIYGAFDYNFNAAANIGLRALTDPDWSGFWWYVLCEPKALRAIADACKGSKAIDADTVLAASPATMETLGKRDQPVNLWRDASVAPLTRGRWEHHSVYWEIVMRQVCAILRNQLVKRAAAVRCEVPF